MDVLWCVAVFVGKHPDRVALTRPLISESSSSSSGSGSGGNVNVYVLGGRTFSKRDELVTYFRTILHQVSKSLTHSLTGWLAGSLFLTTLYRESVRNSRMVWYCG
jgi:hypothetical protein